MTIVGSFNQKAVEHKLVFTLITLQCFAFYLSEELARSFYQAWLFDTISSYYN